MLAVAYRNTERTARPKFEADNDVVVKTYNPRKVRPAPTEQTEAAENMRIRGVPSWVSRIILDVSAAHNVSPFDVLSAKKTIPVRAARHEAIYEVKNTRPVLSCTMIGPWFGRDHKSVLHALASHAHKNNLPKLCGYDIDRAWQRMRDRINARRAA